MDDEALLPVTSRSLFPLYFPAGISCDCLRWNELLAELTSCDLHDVLHETDDVEEDIQSDRDKDIEA